jgi:hypothetical protein
MGLGLPLSIVALAAWLAVLVERPWIALCLATVILVLPSLLLVDRFLPKDDPRKGRGIPTDVLSLVWLGVATLALGPLGPWLHAPLVDFARRATGSDVVAGIAGFVTGPATAEGTADSEAGAEATPADTGGGAARDVDAGATP